MTACRAELEMMELSEYSNKRRKRNGRRVCTASGFSIFSCVGASLGGRGEETGKVYRLVLGRIKP